MGNRNVLTVLIVIFVGVLLYNILYFGGFIGGFGQSDGIIAPSEDDPFGDVPQLQNRNESQQRQQQRPRPTPSTPQGGQLAEGERAGISAVELQRGADWGRNPFLTPQELWALANFQPVYVQTPGAAPSGLYLSAIVMDSTGRRVAVINGDIYAVGDDIGGYRLADVWDDGVVLMNGDQRHVVRIADMDLDLSSRRGVGRE